MILDLAVNPIPLKRARVVYGKRGIHAYTPAESAAFQESMRWLLRAKGVTPAEGHLSVKLGLWRRCRGLPGDIDNLAKSILDAGNGLLWGDDRQIKELYVKLHDSGPRVTGRVLIEIQRAERKPKEVTVPT